MSYWYSSFKSAFFQSWIGAGLPDPELVPRTDWDYWQAEPLPADLQRCLEPSSTRALQPKLISTVYGFGCFIGRVCGQLFGLEESQVAVRADWCGRLNLGISLFDFVCDELPEQTRNAMLALPVFAPFSGQRHESGREDAGEIGRFLEGVAGSVLRDVTREVGAPNAHRLRYGLWRAFRAMYAAQLFATTKLTEPETGTTSYIQCLRLKSSEPFRVMSEWMARVDASRVSTRQAAHFGRCLGDCFWLVDDARDVWVDLDGGRCNYFLCKAVAMDPALRLDDPNPVLEALLVRTWSANRIAQKASQRAVTGFSNALRGLRQSKAQEMQAANRLAASMARWAR